MISVHSQTLAMLVELRRELFEDWIRGEVEAEKGWQIINRVIGHVQKEHAQL